MSPILWHACIACCVAVTAALVWRKVWGDLR